MCVCVGGSIKGGTEELREVEGRLGSRGHSSLRRWGSNRGRSRNVNNDGARARPESQAAPWLEK